jgi:hypothetical protein
VLLAIVVLAGLVFGLRPRHGTLVVTASEPDALVQVRNAAGGVEFSRKADRTSMKITVPVGKHSLSVEKPGFATVTREVEIEPGGTQSLSAGLVRLPAKTTPAAKPRPRSGDAQRDLAEWLLARRFSFRTTAFESDKIETLPQGSWSVISIHLPGLNDQLAGELAQLASRVDTVEGLYVIADLDFSATGLREFARVKSLTNLGGSFGLARGSVWSLLAELEKLTSLNCGNWPEFDDSVLESVKRLSQLKSLGINACAVTDRGVELISEMRQIESLYFNSGYLTDSIWDHLGRLPHLVKLELVLNHNLTGKGLSKLRGTRIAELSITGCPNLADQALAELASLERLRGLNLSGTRITDIGLGHLEGLGLVHLEVKDTAVTRNGIEKLRMALPSCEIVWDEQ